MVHGTCGQEDVGAMHDKLWDEQHVEVFPSNVSYVEHQFFFVLKEDIVLKVLMVQKIFEQQRKAPVEEAKALPGVSLPTMEEVGKQEEPRRVDQYG